MKEEIRYMPRLTTIILGFLTAAAAGQEIGIKPLSFEVASVKRNTDDLAFYRRVEQDDRIRYFKIPMTFLIEIAYNIKPYQLKGPSGLIQDQYDIEALLPKGSDRSQIPLFLQHLLVERFALSVHWETADTRVHVLAIDTGGLKSPPSPPNRSVVDNGMGGIPSFIDPRTGRLHVDGPLTMEELADLLSNNIRQPVLNRTGLTGEFDIKLDAYTRTNIEPEETTSSIRLPNGTKLAQDASSLPAALKRLGLRFEDTRAPIEYLVVDRVQKIPTAN
jgi:uncharacterized protein (TIGR03435 family)